MVTRNPGIDYSMDLPMANGKVPNVDPDTGIRYGVINQNHVLQAWADSSEAQYPCEHCECWDKEEGECVGSMHVCEVEPTSWVLDDGEYLAKCGEDGDIFVLKSPYFTYAQFCSPCAPGACYLMNPVSEENAGNKCYCFSADWFDDEPCPYEVYRVADGVKVYTPESNS